MKPPSRNYHLSTVSPFKHHESAVQAVHFMDHARTMQSQNSNHHRIAPWKHHASSAIHATCNNHNTRATNSASFKHRLESTMGSPLCKHHSRTIEAPLKHHPGTMQAGYKNHASTVQQSRYHKASIAIFFDFARHFGRCRCMTAALPSRGIVCQNPRDA